MLNERIKRFYMYKHNNSSLLENIPANKESARKEVILLYPKSFGKVMTKPSNEKKYLWDSDIRTSLKFHTNLPK